jgi:hypothetical protein
VGCGRTLGHDVCVFGREYVFEWVAFIRDFVMHVILPLLL